MSETSNRGSREIKQDQISLASLGSAVKADTGLFPHVSLYLLTIPLKLQTCFEVIVVQMLSIVSTFQLSSQILFLDIQIFKFIACQIESLPALRAILISLGLE